CPRAMALTERILTGILALCAAASLAGYAARATAALDEGTPSVVFDPTVLERLQQLQTEHRKTRDQALKEPRAWDEGRAQRAELDRAELAGIWSNLVDSADAQARLRIHADHMARLNRMLDLAQAPTDAALTQRIQAAIQSELRQHAEHMQTLRAALRPE
ncbi:MAG TPA: hypothetical protein VHW01_04490, partial [Polyangiaceae bacterium]|nr:hypothetical protein [Polyangiaceae bacterium]